jgi:hypothetical protein
MKAFTYLLLLMLLAGLGGAAFFFFTIYRPMAAEHARMKIGMPEMDQAKAELNKYREMNNWLKLTAETLSTGLDKEVKAGTAEVVAAENGTVVINISEKVLYTPGSVTFAKDSPEARAKIASLLKSLKLISDKVISIGNTTDPSPPQGNGRRKIPGREARELASARSLALVKDLEKNGVAQASLISTAYPAKQSDQGFKIRDHKTVIIIGYPPRPAPAAVVPAAPQTKPVPAPKGPAPTTAPAPAQPKPIPIQPAPPKPL